MTEEEQPDKKHRSQEGNPFAGYLIFTGLCIVAYYFDVPLIIIIIAIVGYVFSRY